MAQTINNGQEDWLTVLNAGLSQIGDKTSSIKVPVTMLNGCSGGINCTKYTIGTQVLNVAQGSFQTGAELSPNMRSIEFAQLDVNGATGIAHASVTNWAVVGTVTVSDGKLKLTISNGDASVITKGTWFDLFLVQIS